MLVIVKPERSLFFDQLAALIGTSPEVATPHIGVYQIGYFSFDLALDNYKLDKWPDLQNIGCYGVCDNYQQILTQEPMLVTDDRKFVIAITPIVKADEPERDGWRWHKWGDYIGEQKPTTEYIYDEPEIDQVFCYHIYEILS